MVRILMAFALLVAFTFTASAADTKYSLTGDNAKITFVGTKPDGKHDGGFKKLTGTATVTDGTLTAIEVEIATDSLWSDDQKLTTHLKSPDFFGVKDNPKATFKTTKIEKTKEGYDITGDLTMLGKTKSIKFPAKVTADDSLNLTAEFKIDRTQWGMVYGKGKINDEVALKLNVSAKK